MYGPQASLVELLGDRVGLSVSDINDIVIAYVEYVWFNGEQSISDREIIETYFMGDPMGYDLLYAVQAQLPEIGSFVPDDINKLKYGRTVKGGFYILGTIDEHIAHV